MTDIFGNLADQALVLGVSSTRFAIAFAAMPLMSTETVPATVRNSIVISFGLIILMMAPPIAVAGLTSLQWIALFLKEAFVGLVIGFLFASVLWAMELAGNYIDTKVGATMAQIVDPLSGHQTSLTGEFLGRLANYAFIASGGLLVLVGSLLQSYAIWPIDQLMPDLNRITLTFFTDEFGRMMVIALLVAAPALVVLFGIDLAMGLLNRFAQQLNVFSLAMSIKAAAGIFVILLMLTTLVQLVVQDIAARQGHALYVLAAILRGANE